LQFIWHYVDVAEMGATFLANTVETVQVQMS